ncbi:thermonuclease family protein [Ciceribacter ferrooxidans]|nr:thermonuclease family protein [Ciceribacter ferrooxidans]
MRKLLIAITLSLAASSALSATHVVDGDTVVIDGEKIRIFNIDAPELRHAACDAERRLAEVAKRRLDALLAGRPVIVVRSDNGRMKDRYGRTLARLTVDGRDVGEILIEEELARPWEGKRQPWCGQE